MLVEKEEEEEKVVVVEWSKVKQTKINRKAQVNKFEAMDYFLRFLLLGLRPKLLQNHTSL